MTQDHGLPLDPNLFGDAPWAKLPETIDEDEEVETEVLPPEEEEYEEEEEESSSEPAYRPMTPPEPQNYGLPQDIDLSELADEFEEESAPAGFKQLFDNRRSTDITKLTETPPKMVLPLVRARIIDAAYDPERVANGESLLEIFVQEFDKRMISKDRKGRLEAVELIRGLQRSESDEEEANL